MARVFLYNTNPHQIRTYATLLQGHDWDLAESCVDVGVFKPPYDFLALAPETWLNSRSDNHLLTFLDLIEPRIKSIEKWRPEIILHYRSSSSFSKKVALWLDGRGYPYTACGYGSGDWYRTLSIYGINPLPTPPSQDPLDRGEDEDDHEYAPILEAGIPPITWRDHPSDARDEAEQVEQARRGVVISSISGTGQGGTFTMPSGATTYNDIIRSTTTMWSSNPINPR